MFITAFALIFLSACGQKQESTVINQNQSIFSSKETAANAEAAKIAVNKAEEAAQGAADMADKAAKDAMVRAQKENK